MKKIFGLAIIFLCVLSSTSQSQSIKGIELSTIQAMVNDSGVYNYNFLVKRFNLFDLALNDVDYIMLYYGFTYQDAYNPYTHLVLEDSLNSLTNQKKGEEALKLADELLKQNPVSLFGNVEKAFVLHALGKTDESNKYLQRYSRLMEAIESSGIGNSYESPIMLISPKDAEAIILKYKLNVISKSINGQDGKYYEVYLVQNEKRKEYPIYFDITLPYTIGMKKLQSGDK